MCKAVVGRIGRLTAIRLGIVISLMVLITAVEGTFSQSSAETGEDMFEKVATEVGKSVVSITAVQTETVQYTNPFEGLFGEDFFKYFFESPQGHSRRETPKPKKRIIRYPVLGSGVIIDEKGYILTNEHVIHNADPDKITVKLPDGRKFPGKITGSDPRSDLAVVKIVGKNLPVAKLGDSDTLKVGQWVIAIGNPFGFLLNDPQPTLTVGVVSALNRALSGTPLGKGKFYEGLIQTDAAINRGNSGGPLVNSKGEVIGINVAIFSTSGGSEGIGFAIPINTARGIIGNLIKGKKISYGWLGVSIQNLDPNLSKKFRFSPEQNGVLVGGVIENSPAGKAGLKQGDIITEVEGKTINSASELVRVIGRTPVGKKVEIKIFRDGKEKVLTVKIGERPSKPGELNNEQKLWRGIKAQELTKDLAKRLGLPEEKEGVLVSEVETGSAAYEAGLKSGNVIDEIDRVKIRNLEDYRRVIKGIKAEEDVLIHTDGGYTVIRGKK